MSFLICTSATATFGSLVAVDHIDLIIERHSVVGIGGPNGAGKTTFLDLISGLVPLREGGIELDGVVLDGMPAHKRARLGVARTFQLNAGFDSMTVYENVLTAVVFGNQTASRRKPLWSRADHHRTCAYLEEFGLTEKTDVEVSRLAALDRKKLMVVTALASDPKVLLLDEPVGGLTPTEIDEFADLIIRLKEQGHTIVFIEHVMSFLTKVADRAVIMHHGSLIFDGVPSEIAHNETVAEVYLGSAAAQMRGDLS
ncbi:ABC transporter ATP-binding protein [uncultured Roseovarius sp.]|uniref:ABC transporter ATP-binding protein n=1 Tax=uncultured Roseovarius sp. TaxID=293344 RepID=UPI002632687B|nr:ATP-binding cassette domain-containing protein [uncultured Roseovarius sp.]